MNKTLGQEYTSGLERTNFLKDNCDAVESLTYSKEFSLAKMEDVKEQLAGMAIKVHDVTEEKKEAMKGYSEQLKSLEKEMDELIQQMKAKAELVTEACFKFTENGETGYYNNEGKLVYLRKSSPKEMQGTIQGELRHNALQATGTN